MSSWPLDSTHGRLSSGMPCHHRPLDRTHDRTASGGMPFLPLDSTDDRPSSGVACYHSPWTSHTVGRRRARHAIIAFGQHTQSKDVERGIQSSPLGSTDGRMTSGVACHYRLWNAHTVERRRACMPSSPLESTHGRTTSGVACHHRLWEAHTVEQRRVWHAIIDVGHHTRSTKLSVACHHRLWTR